MNTEDPDIHAEQSHDRATEVTPTEVTPTEVTPTEVTPTEVTPTEVTPTEVTPTELELVSTAIDCASRYRSISGIGSEHGTLCSLLEKSEREALTVDELSYVQLIIDRTNEVDRNYAAEPF